MLRRGVPVPLVDNDNGRNPYVTIEMGEWMMGLPLGWVSDIRGLNRAAKMKLIGNGVVPQCAARAWSELYSNLVAIQEESESDCAAG